MAAKSTAETENMDGKPFYNCCKQLMIGQWGENESLLAYIKQKLMSL